MADVEEGNDEIYYGVGVAEGLTGEEMAYCERVGDWREMGEEGLVVEGVEEEEEEEDDVDFNPESLHSPSREPSSAAGSEGEEEGEEIAGVPIGMEVSGAEVEGEEDLEGFEIEDDEEFLELGSEVDEEEFADDEEDDNEDEEEDEEEFSKGEGGYVNSSHQEWRDAIEVDLGEQESMMQRRGLEGNLHAVWCSDSIEGLDQGEKDRLSASIFDLNTKYSSSQEGVEEEMMMGRALEGLPELRSPRSEWGQQVNASQQRPEEEEATADAISKRTRAHYSLADMSLDQLETFLQESDEEDYFQNVDDEEEYRKFLAAVQEKIHEEEDENTKEKAIEEETESEDEDADFEIEIEEALESEFEEGLDGDCRKRRRGRRPETREKRRQRAKLQNKVRLLGLAKAPLRPLLPYEGVMPVHASLAERSKIMANKLSKACSSKAKCQTPVNGFTADQIGQLYCMIHEHVQLLIQVFALSIFEPGKQQIALDTRGMLMELVEKRESVLSWKQSAFPDFCFHRPYTHPSVMPSIHGVCSGVSLNGYPPVAMSNNSAFPPSMVFESDSHQQFVHDSGLSTNGSLMEENATFGISLSEPSQGNFTSSITDDNRADVGGDDSHQSSISAYATCPGSLKLSNSSCDPVASSETALPLPSIFPGQPPSEWMPTTFGSVRSLIDVAPLALVKDFLAAIEQLVQDSRQQHVEGEAFPSFGEKEPLFAVQVEVDQRSQKATGRTQELHVFQAGPRISPIPQVKRTMAAALVESTKKQAIALVPRNVAIAAQPFLPFFNKGLFPHKAPSASTANRLLFTDAEDELLAMGLLTYNSDWKAIQQRYLPSKSMHQIFVRQKNRSSAKAPENSIKAVRQMKSSPLSVDEKACIEKGLKVFKYDWTKVWYFCVPHRDPATLPRQWRIAIGTQKSYKSNETNKERRRIYEAGRRQAMAAQKEEVKEEGPMRLMTSALKGHKATDGEAEVANTDFAFLHGWNPLSNTGCSSIRHSPIFKATGSSTTMSLDTEIENLKDYGIFQRDPSTVSPAMTFTSSSPSVHVQRSMLHIPPPLFTTSQHVPHSQTIKLAPGLPPLRLPSTVRVLSQSETVDLQTLSHRSSIASAGSSQRPSWVQPAGQEAKKGRATAILRKSSFQPEI